MKTVGLITEYNPFHNGHQFHIAKAKELTGADRIIVIMSGNYVQRGTPAIMDKYLRAKAALYNGASLVLELPIRYATGTAEQFAFGAISILESLGCVDAVCFGSECGNLNQLFGVAQLLTEEPLEYRQQLQTLLRKGLSYPVARMQALSQLYPDKNYGELLNLPNNILSVEYLKALLRLNSSIKPYTIQRVSNSYHDTKLCEGISSASAIRNHLSNTDFEEALTQLPQNTHEMLRNEYQKRFPIYPDDFSLLLKYRLMQEDKQTIIAYEDVSEELANRIYHRLNQYVSFEQFSELLKTKEITYTRISRALLHILLGIKKTDVNKIDAVRMLGFKNEHADVLSAIKKYGSVELLVKTTECPPNSPDIQADNLYESVITNKYQTSFINEYEHPMIRI